MGSSEGFDGTVRSRYYAGPPQYATYANIYGHVGCPVCGGFCDFSGWPEWLCLKTPALLVCLVLGYMLDEYLCVDCFNWARNLGADWNGRIRLGFTGLKACKYGCLHACDHERVPVVASQYRPGATI